MDFFFGIAFKPVNKPAIAEPTELKAIKDVPVLISTGSIC
jgi:hypothetical protein